MNEKTKKTVAIVLGVFVVVLVGVLLVMAFAKNEYKVTFDSNGGSAVPSQTVKKNHTVDSPADPTRDGYTFAGWYLDLTDTERFDFSTKVTKNITLHAKWAQDGDSNQCTLSCDDGYTLDKDNCKCVKDDEEPEEKVDVAKVTASRTSVSLKVGDTFTVKLTITPNNATDKTATWKSSNSKVATVDKNGKITAVGAGTAKVTATVDGKSVTITVSVAANDQPTVNPGGSTSNPGSSTDTPSNPNTPSTPDTPTTPEEQKPQNVVINGISLDKSSASINVKGSVNLVATVTPNNTTDNVTITWSSSNTSVATVENGKVVGKSAGSAIITATVKASDGKEYKAQATITVNDVYTFTVEPYSDFDQQVRVTVYKNGDNYSSVVDRVRDANGTSLGKYVASTGFIMVDRNYIDAISTIKIDGHLISIKKTN